ncbi:glycosyltransferase [Erythrobacter sp. R86502]|uniref:glycosyltransferase n=1 Tax=Erythrobacter sp. R86502 TaxID=3093846 RepID=UPI0036D28229
MRTCSIVNSLTTGGAEVLVCALTQEFARVGDQPLVIALCDAETVGNSAETEARMIREITSAGGTFRSLRLSAKRNPVVGALRLKRVMKDFAPDVVHAHTVRALPMLALSSMTTPTVLTHHNTRLPFPPWLFTIFDRMTDSYVAIGADVEAILRRFVGKPVVRIPNAANRSFKAGNPRAIAGHPSAVLSVGAISRQKNYDLLIDVAAALKSIQHPRSSFRFLVAGGGPDLEQMRARTQQRGLDDIVEFLGERSDVPHLMANSDIYLNVSLFEGMPLTLLEAMASGLPIVATDVPGNRELVEEGFNGLMVPLGNAAAIAEKIMRMVEDSNLYQRLSIGAIARSGAFSIERTATLHRNLYRELVAGRRKRTGECQKGVV